LREIRKVYANEECLCHYTKDKCLKCVIDKALTPEDKPMTIPEAVEDKEEVKQISPKLQKLLDKTRPVSECLKILKEEG
jgi:hypothetical protein